MIHYTRMNTITKQLFDYLCKNYGKNMLTGQQETPCRGRHEEEVEYVKQVTGRYPAIRGLDYIHDDFEGVNRRAIRWWQDGGIVTICWHTGVNGGGYQDSQKDQPDFKKLLTPGTPEQNKMLESWDRAAKALQELKEAGVPVLWRPFHEFDGGWFWWGKDTARTFKRLWRMMYNRFTKKFELDNLIWVLGYSHIMKSGWNPGSRYWDIAGSDVYDGTTHLNAWKKLWLRRLSGRPMAFHECGNLPHPDAFQKDGCLWSWFMVWHSNFIRDNNKDNLIATYHHPLMVTREMLPRFPGQKEHANAPEDKSMDKKKLGFGLMRLPLTNRMDDGSVDMDTLKAMVDTFMERGFTYFDTALMYNDCKSEGAIREALVERYPRDSYTIATKLHGDFFNTKEDRDRIFNEQLRRIGVEYFDYYLMHDVGEGFYQKYMELDCFNWLLEKKAQGLVRHAGFSFHDGANMLDKVLTEHPEMDFVQLQINYLDWDSEGIQSRKCYEVARKHGKPVFVMEPVKGGTLAKLPDEVEAPMKAMHPDWSIPSWAIRFAASLPGVEMVLSGMSDMPQLLDNTSYMQNFEPLTAAEQDMVKKAVDQINSTIAIPCTGCSYCTGGCPMNIAIPRYFSLYNTEMQEPPEKDWTTQGEYYDRLTATFGKAGDCIGCGQCEHVCPQHLPIMEHLKQVKEHFGK